MTRGYEMRGRLAGGVDSPRTRWMADWIARTHQKRGDEEAAAFWRERSG